MEVGLGPGDIMLDGDPAPPKGAQSPNFQRMSIVANGRPSQLLLSSCTVTVGGKKTLLVQLFLDGDRPFSNSLRSTASDK